MPRIGETRQSGVLLHPTSLPGPYGIGDLGTGARRFVEWLAQARQQLWQVLPLNPTSHGNSPYTSPSAFAGNTLLLSLEALRDDGLLAAQELASAPSFPMDQVDYGAVYAHRQALFARVAETFRSGAAPALRAGLDEFRHAARGWLPDHALFKALHARFGYVSWPRWERAIARREPAALARWRAELAEEVEREEILQFLFARQWSALRAVAHEKGVRILGDVPIFVAFDSADVWANPHLFQLGPDLLPTVVAGVPPDYFSAHGQLWGNPHYDWAAMAREGYRWWIERIRAVAATVDVIRVDHFRGFVGAWEVKAGAKTAREGRWAPGPGRALFDALRAALGPLELIAEDLGVITPDVEALRESLELPGMKVLQFAFGDPESDSGDLPHNHRRRCVVYTGTHDNDTTRGWWSTLDAKARRHVQEYLRTDGKDIAWDLVRAAWASVGRTAIAPLQDLLDLGSAARMNLPGRAEGNWAWRFRAEALTPALAGRLSALTALYGRAPRPPVPKGA